MLVEQKLTVVSFYCAAAFHRNWRSPKQNRQINVFIL